MEVLGLLCPGRVRRPLLGKVVKVSRGRCSHPAPPCPPRPQRTSPSPPLIRCLIAERSGPTPFLRKWGPHPAQPRSRPQRWAWPCAPPPTWRRRASDRGRAYGTQALLSWKAGPPVFLLLTWVPSGAGAHPPATPVPPAAAGALLHSPSVGFPDSQTGGK